MIERGEVEPHLGLRCGDPHAQIGESDLKPRHDLIFGVIQFLHFAFACSKLFLPAKDESQGSTGLFTVVQLAFPSDAGGFEQDAPVMHFPLCL